MHVNLLIKILVQKFTVGVIFKTWCSSKRICLPIKRRKRCGFNLWVRKFPWRRKWHPTPVFLPGKPHGQRSLVGYSPRGLKELTRLSNGTYAFLNQNFKKE